MSSPPLDSTVVPAPDAVPALQNATPRGNSRKLSSQELAGFGFVAITAFGWGFNWPIVKYLLSEWPPLTSRGIAGLVGAVLLAAFVKAQGRSLAVPRHLWGRLVLLAMLTVTIWLACIGLSLLWLRAGETAIITATMPIWVSLLAWPVLGEQFSAMRAFALVLAIVALGYLFGDQGLSISLAKLPGILLALAGCICVSVGTVLVKRLPLPLPPMSLAAWQIGIGCVPLVLAGFAFENPQLNALSPYGWAALAYSVAVQFCVCYAAWFAALERLPASTTTIAMLSIPVIGVLSAAVMLGEPLGLPQIAAMVLTLGAVGLAIRS